MQLLLDTHALIWWLTDSDSLSTSALDAVANPLNTVFVSAASAWEIATKHRIGKLPRIGRMAAELDEVLAHENFLGLAISLKHAESAGALPGAHRDPFDRMLIAQALAESLTLVTNERVFNSYGVARLW